LHLILAGTMAAALSVLGWWCLHLNEWLILYLVALLTVFSYFAKERAAKERARRVVSLFTKPRQPVPKAAGFLRKHGVAMVLNHALPFSGSLYKIGLNAQHRENLVTYSKDCEKNFKFMVDEIEGGVGVWRTVSGWRSAADKLTASFLNFGGIDNALSDPDDRAHCMLFYAVACAVSECARGGNANKFAKLQMQAPLLEPGNEVNLMINKFIAIALNCPSIGTILQGAVIEEVKALIWEEVVEYLRDTATDVMSDVAVSFLF
jgi:hypothetical protein